MFDRDPLSIVGSTVAEKYVIERMVGEGGFAVVYRALHTIWKKPVAIKFFSGLSAAPVYQREALTESFIQEGALLTELSTQSANIVQARDVGTYTSPDGQWMPYMVLEWLDGKGLDDVLEAERARGLPPWQLQQVVQLLLPVAHALDIVHRKGIAHRDIKPANLFVIGGDPRTDNCTIKLLDFGVAKLMADNTQMQAALRARRQRRGPARVLGGQPGSPPHPAHDGRLRSGRGRSGVPDRARAPAAGPVRQLGRVLACPRRGDQR
jgi:eukaryotic-like serine/threonine-protein kinase